MRLHNFLLRNVMVDASQDAGATALMEQSDAALESRVRLPARNPLQ